MIALGTWSLLLLLASLHGLLGAAFLCATRSNRIANRLLAALLLVVVLKITPYTIGYAGFYDAYPWLTFAPFFWELAIGPLVWLYVRQLAHARLPRGWGWHLLPAAIQGGYYLRQFVRPLQDKWAFNASVHVPWILPAETAATLVSLALYLALAWREYRRYQRWLEAHSAAREEWRLAWLQVFLVAMALATLLLAGFTLAGWMHDGLTYFQEFPLYVGLAAWVYVLGLLGWRHAADVRPMMDAAAPALDAAAHAPDESAALPTRRRGTTERDWAAFGQRVREAVVAGAWWREPDLDLDELARRLGTNTNYLSRALNEGLGASFSTFVNRLRIDEARERLRGGEDVLAIGLAVGFGSKASFNRVFRASTGQSPSAWRAAQRLES